MANAKLETNLPSVKFKAMGDWHFLNQDFGFMHDTYNLSVCCNQMKVALDGLWLRWGIELHKVYVSWLLTIWTWAIHINLYFWVTIIGQ
jgi:hypothetical protein